MKLFSQLSEFEMEKIRREVDATTIYDETNEPYAKIIFSVPKNEKIAKSCKDIKVILNDGTELLSKSIILKDYYYNKSAIIGNVEHLLYHVDLNLRSNDIAMIRIHDTIYAIENIDDYIGEKIQNKKCPLRLSLKRICPYDYVADTESWPLASMPYWLIDTYKKDQLLIYNGFLYINGKYVASCEEVLNKCKEKYPNLEIKEWYKHDLNDLFDSKIEKESFNICVERTGIVPTSYYTTNASGGFDDEEVNQARLLLSNSNQEISKPE